MFILANIKPRILVLSSVIATINSLNPRKAAKLTKPYDGFTPF